MSSFAISSVRRRRWSTSKWQCPDSNRGRIALQATATTRLSYIAKTGERAPPLRKGIRWDLANHPSGHTLSVDSSLSRLLSRSLRCLDRHRFPTSPLNQWFPLFTPSRGAGLGAFTTTFVCTTEAYEHVCTFPPPMRRRDSVTPYGSR